MIAVSLVGAWLARARRPAIETERSLVLRHSLRTRILYVVMAALLLAITAGAMAFAKERWVWPCFAFFAGLGLGSAVDALRVRHELTEAGIVYRGLWFRYDRVPWRLIVSARWNHTMKWLSIATSDGRVLRFQALLNGFDALAIALHERVPELDTDDATEQMLSDARDGTMPPAF